MARRRHVRLLVDGGARHGGPRPRPPPGRTFALAGPGDRGKGGRLRGLPTLATIARADDDYTLAGELFGEGLLFSAEVGDGTNVAYYLEGLATLAAAEDAPERAARLWGAAEAILEGIEVIAYPHATDRSFNDRQLASARGSLDRRTWEEAWAGGRSMTTEEAVAYALERDEEPVPGPTGPGEAGDRDAARNL